MGKTMEITNHWEYQEALVRERVVLRAEIERLRAALKEIATGPPDGMSEKRWLEQVRTLALDNLPPLYLVEQIAGETK